MVAFEIHKKNGGSVSFGWLSFFALLLGLAGSVAGGIMAAGEYLIFPRIESKIRAVAVQEVQPVRAEISRLEVSLASRREELSLLREDIRRIEDRIEYLVRLQMEQRHGR